MADFEYNKEVTPWEEPGVEPQPGLRKWQAGEEPPAAWFNWFWDTVQKCFGDIKNWINGHKDAGTGVHGVEAGHIESSEGAQAKVDNEIIAHLAAPDPHSQYADETMVNQAFSNDPSIGHNHNGPGKGAPIPGSAIAGAVATATNASSITTAAFTSHFAIETGTVGHNQYIPLPVGFTQEQCKWIVSLYSINGQEADKQSVSWQCYANPSTRQVTCLYSSFFGTFTGTAFYMIIGVK